MHNHNLIAIYKRFLPDRQKIDKTRFLGTIMHSLSTEPSPSPRLRAMSDPARYGGDGDTVGAGAALPVHGTRNTSRASTFIAMSAPHSTDVKPRPIRKPSFDRAFSKAIPSLRRFDQHASEAYRTYPFQATNLHKKMEEYASAAQQLLAALSVDPGLSNTSCQRDALNRLINATHALIDAFPEWEQRSMASSPSLKDFLHTLMGKPKPLDDVQKHLNTFSVWLENKYALLNNDLDDTAAPI